MEDPDALMREWYSAQAEELSPNVKMFRIIRSLLIDAEKFNDEEKAREAAIMALELGVSLDAVKAGVIQPLNKPGPGHGGSPDQPLPLLGSGQQVGGMPPNTMADQLRKQPNEPKGVPNAA